MEMDTVPFHAAEWSSGTQARDEGSPLVRDLATSTHVQVAELRELGNVLQPRVCDLVAATQAQGDELRELGNVLHPHARDLVTVIQVGVACCLPNSNAQYIVAFAIIGVGSGGVA